MLSVYFYFCAHVWCCRKMIKRVANMQRLRIRAYTSCREQARFGRVGVACDHPEKAAERRRMKQRTKTMFIKIFTKEEIDRIIVSSGTKVACNIISSGYHRGLARDQGISPLETGG